MRSRAPFLQFCVASRRRPSAWRGSEIGMTEARIRSLRRRPSGSVDLTLTSSGFPGRVRVPAVDAGRNPSTSGGLRSGCDGRSIRLWRAIASSPRRRFGTPRPGGYEATLRKRRRRRRRQVRQTRILGSGVVAGSAVDRGWPPTSCSQQLANSRIERELDLHPANAG